MSRLGLFRAEVIESLNDGSFGHVIKIKPLSFLLITSIAIGFSLATIFYLSILEYSRKYTVPGYLLPSTGAIQIQSEREGQVVSLNVEEGELITAGQPLLTIASAENLAGGKNAHSAQLSELERQQYLLEQELKDKKALFDAQKSELELEKKALKDKLKHLKNQLSIHEKLYDFSEKAFEQKAQQLESGLISKDQYFREFKDTLRIKEAKENVEHNLNEASDRLAMVELKLSNHPIYKNQEIMELERLISEKKFETIEVSFQQSATVKSPISGQVIALNVRGGDMTKRNDTMMVVAESQYELEANLYVPSHSIGFVEPGLPVYVKYDAFPHERFGLFKAEVTAVSRTIYSPESISSNHDVPISVREPVYRVSVKLDSQHIEAFGQSFSLQNGMTLSADIEYDRRKLIDWLLSPFSA